ncbi:MAG: hypothetical protein OXF02_06280 [Simkaniaceae bacterium]|nr:hypothetical protein [Simkaniaceae bacterium]
MPSQKSSPGSGTNATLQKARYTEVERDILVDYAPETRSGRLPALESREKSIEECNRECM